MQESTPYNLILENKTEIHNNLTDKAGMKGTCMNLSVEIHNKQAV
jgi:hypothetical protein